MHVATYKLAELSDIALRPPETKKRMRFDASWIDEFQGLKV